MFPYETCWRAWRKIIVHYWKNRELHRELAALPKLYSFNLSVSFADKWIISQRSSEGWLCDIAPCLFSLSSFLLSSCFPTLLSCSLSLEKLHEWLIEKYSPSPSCFPPHFLSCLPAFLGPQHLFGKWMKTDALQSLDRGNQNLPGENVYN